ncbi:MAG: hypothetical protein M5U15_13625 [Kiritimatiellae bacterium]|nr:hypothetical protein [Kiritimatiellia bacterium]
MVREDVGMAILHVLSQCRGFKLPRESLFERVRLRMGESVSYDELILTLQFTRDADWVAFDLNSFRRERFWLTQRGQMQLSDGV